MKLTKSGELSTLIEAKLLKIITRFPLTDEISPPTLLFELDIRHF